MISNNSIIATTAAHGLTGVQLLLLFFSYLVVTAGLIYIFKKKIMSKSQRLLVACSCIIFLTAFSAVAIYNYTRICFLYGGVLVRAEVLGPFTDAIWEGDLETIKSIMLKNPKLTNKASLNRTLNDAIALGHNHIVEYVIINGADVNFKDSNYGWTPLHSAVFCPNGENDTFSNENKVFQHSTLPNLKQSIEILIKYNADVNARDKKGITPLGIAVFYDLKEIASLLREHGGVE